MTISSRKVSIFPSVLQPPSPDTRIDFVADDILAQRDVIECRSEGDARKRYSKGSEP
jgi:hypothetical protein